MSMLKDVLYKKVERLNKMVGFDKVEYNTVGAYQIDAANGGYLLEKIMCTAGSAHNVFMRTSPGRLTALLDAYIAGIHVNLKEVTGYFSVSRVHKDDIRAAFKHNQTALDVIDGLDDSDMNHLASKMGDDYTTQLFWGSLEVIFEDMYLRKGE